VVSELTAVFTVKPGHAEQLRAACERFMDIVRSTDAGATQKTGLRDVRIVMFDDDHRVLLAPSFETDWDPYIDDVIAVYGPQNWFDLFQHLVEFRPQGELSPEQGKQFLQAYQAPANGYYNVLADATIPEIRKALRLEQAFQQVLDNPEAAQALQHPALKPLLEQAAE
jgi:hypothetical protein